MRQQPHRKVGHEWYSNGSAHQASSKQQRPKRRSLFVRLFIGLWQSFITALAMFGLVAVVGGAWAVTVGMVQLPLDFELPSMALDKPLQLPQAPRLSSAVEALTQEAFTPPKRVIYLNREGGIITGGSDDSSRNVSSVVEGAGLESYEVPEFRSSSQRWNAIMECVQDRFEDYDVDVVDQRPVEGDYIMAMIGGRPGELATRSGHNSTRRTRITGLAPLGNRPNHDAVVFVFSREMNERTRDVCETVAEEVGHAYGLDHVLDCHDPMTHLPSCGRQTFQDRFTVCGEKEARACVNGAQAQNSHQHLLLVLGARQDA